MSDFDRFDKILNETMRRYRETLEDNVFGAGAPLAAYYATRPKPLTKKQKRKMKKRDRKERRQMARDVLRGRHDCGDGW